MKKKYKASLALAFSAAGFLLSIPYRSAAFWGGCLHHGFLAAMIGGLADWFAVTALFRRPLGISYHTEILTRNRERLMNSLVDFASRDLLSTEHIMEIVRREDLGQMLADYFMHREGREKLEMVFGSFLQTAFAGRTGERFLQQALSFLQDREKISPLAEAARTFLIEVLSAPVFQKRCIQQLSICGEDFWHSTGWQSFLKENLTLICQRYTDGATGRSMVFQMMGLSGEKFLSILNEKIPALFAGGVDSPSGKILQEKWLQQLEWMQSQKGQEVLLNRLCNLLQSAEVQRLLSAWGQKWLASSEGGISWMKQQLDQKIMKIADSAEEKQHLDTWMKGMLARELSEHHAFIAGMIQERLAAFSDEELVSFVETRIADDLQMIRINGSVVGALVGMGLYIVVYCLERMYGV